MKWASRKQFLKHQLPEEMIAGSDQAAKALAAARKIIAVLPGSRGIRLHQQDFRDVPGLPDATCC